MKQSLRFFAIGLLTASVLLFGYYFFLDDSTQSNDELTVDELVSALEDEGYRAIPESDYVAFSFFKEEEMKSDEEDGKEEKPKKNEKEKDNNEDKNKDKKDKKKEDKKDKNENVNDDKNADNNNNDDDVIKHTFTTGEGVVSQEIADILIEEKIIDDRKKFLDYLDDNDYSSKIQIGKFTVSSDMSMKEIAEVITTYPGN